MSTVLESNALVERMQSNGEMQAVAAEAAAQHEIQSAILIAKRIPRNEDAAFAAIVKSCERPSFAVEVTYSFPRGGQQVSGPSVYLARELARIWGNIRHGCYITHDDDKKRTIRAWAWDLQTNTKVESEDTFEKLVQRKKFENGQKTTVWVTPDERDLRELTNRRAAIAKRNALLELLPADLVNDALKTASETLQKDVQDDPDAHRKAVIKAFQGIGVRVEDLEGHLGHKVAQASPAEIVELRRIWKSINDGQSTWAEYDKEPDTTAATNDKTAKLREKLNSAKGKKLATVEQSEKIRGLAKELKLEEENVYTALAHFNAKGIEELTEKDAASLIDQMEAELDAMDGK